VSLTTVYAGFPLPGFEANDSPRTLQATPAAWPRSAANAPLASTSALPTSAPTDTSLPTGSAWIHQDA
jgi:hypothetical protein